MSPIGESASPLVGPAVTDAGFRLTFPYRPDARDLVYVVERSSDLTTWVQIYRYDTSKNANY